jgi:hypothetical protein
MGSRRSRVLRGRFPPRSRRISVSDQRGAPHRGRNRRGTQGVSGRPPRDDPRRRGARQSVDRPHHRFRSRARRHRRAHPIADPNGSGTGAGWQASGGVGGRHLALMGSTLVRPGAARRWRRRGSPAPRGATRGYEAGSACARCPTPTPTTAPPCEREPVPLRSRGHHGQHRPARDGGRQLRRHARRGARPPTHPRVTASGR